MDETQNENIQALNSDLEALDKRFKRKSKSKYRNKNRNKRYKSGFDRRA